MRKKLEELEQELEAVTFTDYRTREIIREMLKLIDQALPKEVEPD